jgi:hypothetical protein
MLGRLETGAQPILHVASVPSSRPAPLSDPFSLCKTPEQTWTGRVSPLYPFRSLCCQSILEAEFQRTIQPGPAGRMPRLLQSQEEPVPADGVTGFLEERHHHLGRPQRDVRVMD